MRKSLFWSGWSCAILFTALPLITGVWDKRFWWNIAFGAFYAIATFGLLRQANFPHRAIALQTSWLGPLLLGVWHILYLFVLNALQASLLQQTNPTAASIALSFDALSLQFIIAGCVEGLLMLWLFRGYGLIPLAALGVVLRPHFSRSGRSWRNVAKAYPPSWWWLLVLISVLKNWFLAFYIARMGQSMGS